MKKPFVIVGFVILFVPVMSWGQIFPKDTVELKMEDKISLSKTISHEKRIANAVVAAIVKDMDVKALLQTPKNFVHFYAVTLSFNRQGRVDTVYLSRKINSETKRILRLDALLTRRIKAQNIHSKRYASKKVTIPILHHRMYEPYIDYNSGFLQALQNLLPAPPYDRDCILFEPNINPFAVSH